MVEQFMERSWNRLAHQGRRGGLEKLGRCGFRQTRDGVGKPGTGGSDKGGVKKLGTAQTQGRTGGVAGTTGRGGVRKMREGVNNQREVQSKGEGRVGGGWSHGRGSDK